MYDGKPQRAIGADISERSQWQERNECCDLMAETIQVEGVTLAGDKNYDTQECNGELRGMNITRMWRRTSTNRRSAVDQRTTRHAGNEVSQQTAKTSGTIVRWMKMVGC